MEAYLPYIVPLLLLLPPLSLYLITYPRKQASENSDKTLPPGSKGWPVLGESMEYVISGPQKFFRDRMKRHSPDVFRTSLLGEELAVFCGEQGNRFLFANEGKLLTSWWPAAFKKVMAYPEETAGNYRDLAGRLRSLTHDMFKPDALKQYVPVITSVRNVMLVAYRA